MSRRCIDTVMMLCVIGLSACGGGQSSRTSPSDPFTQIAVSPMALSPLAGTNVLLLTVGLVVVGDSAHPLPEIDLRRSALLVAANATLDSALRRDGREVTWLGLEEQRRSARRNPTLGIEPDRLPTQYLFNARIERIPDPLWAQIRTLAAVSNARYVVVPAAVKIAGTPGALTAAFIMVLADARSGNVLARARAQGPAAATPEAALNLAAGTVVLAAIR